MARLSATDVLDQHILVVIEAIGNHDHENIRFEELGERLEWEDSVLKAEIDKLRDARLVEQTPDDEMSSDIELSLSETGKEIHDGVATLVERTGLERLEMIDEEQSRPLEIQRVSDITGTAVSSLSRELGRGCPGRYLPVDWAFYHPARGRIDTHPTRGGIGTCVTDPIVESGRRGGIGTCVTDPMVESGRRGGIGTCVTDPMVESGRDFSSGEHE